MNRLVCILTWMVILALAGTQTAWAGGYRFAYKVRPGQQWEATSQDRSESQFMGKSKVSQHHRRFVYTVKKGAKKGWVKLEARIVSPKNNAAAAILDNARYYADMHRSGELRQVRTKVPPPAPLPNQDQLPPQLVAAQAQSNQFVADMLKKAVFWFPEFPEEALQPGDEFDMIDKTTSSMGPGTMAMQGSVKKIYILEEVADGLAYFSIKILSMSKITGLAGNAADTTAASKGEAIFDMKLGMWAEVTTKTKAKVKLGQNSGPVESPSVHKITMELK